MKMKTIYEKFEEDNKKNNYELFITKELLDNYINKGYIVDKNNLIDFFFHRKYIDLDTVNYLLDLGLSKETLCSYVLFEIYITKNIENKDKYIWANSILNNILLNKYFSQDEIDFRNYCIENTDEFK